MSWFFTSTFVLSCLWWIGSTASVDNGFYEFSSSLHQVAKDMKTIDPHRPAYLKLSHRRSYPLEQCDRHADSCSVLLESTLHISSGCCLFQIFRSGVIEPVDLNSTVRVS